MPNDRKKTLRGRLLSLLDGIPDGKEEEMLQRVEMLIKQIKADLNAPESMKKLAALIDDVELKRGPGSFGRGSKWSFLLGQKPVASATTRTDGDGQLRIENLKTQPPYRGEGLAKGLLQRIIDSSSADLSIQAEPYDDGPLTAEQLRELYGRFGFEPDPEKDKMVLRKAAEEEGGPEILPPKHPLLRPYSSTIGRKLSELLHRRTYGDDQSEKWTPESRRRMEELIGQVAEAHDLSGLQIQLGGARHLRNLGRIWRGSNLPLTSRLSRTAMLPLRALAGSFPLPMNQYDPDLRTIQLPSPLPATLHHELGHHIDLKGEQPEGYLRPEVFFNTERRAWDIAKGLATGKEEEGRIERATERLELVRSMVEAMEAGDEEKLEELTGEWKSMGKQASQEEEAKGIPDRSQMGDLSDLEELKGRLTDMIVQRHLSEGAAGKHYDLRLAGPGGLYSWAIPKAQLPSAGGKNLAIRQPMHSTEYGSFTGRIPSGYGRGSVEKASEGKAMLTALKTGESGNVREINFTYDTGAQIPERFKLLRMSGRDWLIINTTPTEGPGAEKPHFKRITSDELESYLDKVREDRPASVKIDGALGLLEFMKDHAELMSYRSSKKTGGPIIHTERVAPELLSHREVPEELQGQTLLGEVYATDEEGRVIPPQELSGILNSSLAKARESQTGRGLTFRVALFDALPEDLEPMAKKKMIDAAVKMYPDLLHRPPQATTPEGARELQQQVESGEHPLSEEGIVFQTPEGPAKWKRTEESDVIITDIFPGKGKYEGEAAGGFKYSLLPGGKEVGKVGTGISDELRRQMKENPGRFVGRVARIKAQQQFPSGAFRAPRLIDVHEDYPSEGDWGPEIAARMEKAAGKQDAPSLLRRTLGQRRQPESMVDLGTAEEAFLPRVPKGLDVRNRPTEAAPVPRYSPEMQQFSKNILRRGKGSYRDVLSAVYGKENLPDVLKRWRSTRDRYSGYEPMVNPGFLGLRIGAPEDFSDYTKQFGWEMAERLPRKDLTYSDASAHDYGRARQWMEQNPQKLRKRWRLNRSALRLPRLDEDRFSRSIPVRPLPEEDRRWLLGRFRDEGDGGPVAELDPDNYSPKVVEEELGHSVQQSGKRPRYDSTGMAVLDLIRDITGDERYRGRPKELSALMMRMRHDIARMRRAAGKDPYPTDPQEIMDAWRELYRMRSQGKLPHQHGSSYHPNFLYRVNPDQLNPEELRDSLLRGILQQVRAPQEGQVKAAAVAPPRRRPPETPQYSPASKELAGSILDRGKASYRDVLQSVYGEDLPQVMEKWRGLQQRPGYRPMFDTRYKRPENFEEYKRKLSSALHDGLGGREASISGDWDKWTQLLHRVRDYLGSNPEMVRRRWEQFQNYQRPLNVPAPMEDQFDTPRSVKPLPEEDQAKGILGKHNEGVIYLNPDYGKNPPTVEEELGHSVQQDVGGSVRPAIKDLIRRVERQDYEKRWPNYPDVAKSEGARQARYRGRGKEMGALMQGMRHDIYRMTGEYPTEPGEILDAWRDLHRLYQSGALSGGMESNTLYKMNPDQIPENLRQPLLRSILQQVRAPQEGQVKAAAEHVGVPAGKFNRLKRLGVDPENRPAAPSFRSRVIKARQGQPTSFSFREFAESQHGYGSRELFEDMVDRAKRNWDYGKDLPKMRLYFHTSRLQGNPHTRYAGSRINRQVPVNYLRDGQVKRYIRNSGLPTERGVGKFLLEQNSAWSKNPLEIQEGLKEDGDVNLGQFGGFFIPKRVQREKEIYYRPGMSDRYTIPHLAKVLGHEATHSLMPPGVSLGDDEWPVLAASVKSWAAREGVDVPDVTEYLENMTKGEGDFTTLKWKIQDVIERYLQKYKAGEIENPAIEPAVLDKMLDNPRLKHRIINKMSTVWPFVARRETSTKTAKVDDDRRPEITKRVEKGAAVAPPDALRSTWRTRMQPHMDTMKRLQSMKVTGEEATFQPQNLFKPYYGKKWPEVLQKARQYQKSMGERQPGSPTRMDLSSEALSREVPTSVSHVGDELAGVSENGKIRISPQTQYGSLTPGEDEILDRYKSPTKLDTLSHELTHSVDPEAQQRAAEQRGFRVFPPMAGYLGRNEDARYMLNPPEITARLAQIKRRYAKATGNVVDSPEKAQEALSWWVRQEVKNWKNEGGMQTGPGQVAPDFFSFVRDMSNLHLNPGIRKQIESEFGVEIDPNNIDKFLKMLREAMPGMVQAPSRSGQVKGASKEAASPILQEGETMDSQEVLRRARDWAANYARGGGFSRAGGMGGALAGKTYSERTQPEAEGLLGSLGSMGRTARQMARWGSMGSSLGSKVDQLAGSQSGQEAAGRAGVMGRDLLRSIQQAAASRAERIGEKVSPGLRSVARRAGESLQERIRQGLAGRGVHPKVQDFVAGRLKDIPSLTDEQASRMGQNAYLFGRMAGKIKGEKQTPGQRVNPIYQGLRTVVRPLARVPSVQQGLAFGASELGPNTPPEVLEFIDKVRRPVSTIGGARLLSGINPLAGATAAGLSAAQQYGLDPEEYSKTLLGTIPGAGYLPGMDKSVPRPWQSRYWDRARRGARLANRGGRELLRNPGGSVDVLRRKIVSDEDLEKVPRGAEVAAKKLRPFLNNLNAFIPGAGRMGMIDPGQPRPWEGRYWEGARRSARRAGRGLNYLGRKALGGLMD